MMAIVGEEGASAARTAAAAGVDLIQVRAKTLSTRRLHELVRSIVDATGDPRRLIVNGRADIAAMHGVLGVHLPENGLPVASMRAEFPQLVVGVSRHDRTGLCRAEDEGADYAMLGPVFETPGKGRALGLEGLRSALIGHHLQVIAVGGISAFNVASVLRVGVAGVAAIRPFLDPSPSGSIAEFVRAAKPLHNKN
jgi:thiamine-phosphate diphosphorylase